MRFTEPDDLREAELAERAPAPLRVTPAQAALGLGAPFKASHLSGWLLTGFLAFVLLATATFFVVAQYARKETVSGVIEPAYGAVRLTSLRAGIIGAAYVREGDWVRAGQPLFLTKGDQTTEGGASLSSILATSAAAQDAALAAQIRERGSSAEAFMAEIDTKLANSGRQLVVLDQQIVMQQDRIALEEKTLESYERLNAQKYVSDIRFREQQKALISAKQSLAGLESQRADYVAQQRQLRHQRTQAASAAAQDVAELGQSRAMLQERRATQEIERAAVVTAPRAGRVVAVQGKPGSVARPDTLLAIVLPEGVGLQADLWVPSRAVGLIKPGDEVRLMYEAFPYQKFGVGRGRIATIARAPTMPSDLPIALKTEEALYRVTASIDRPYVEAYGQQWRLAVGSRLSADIILERRSFAEWLLEPLRSVQRSVGGAAS